MAKSFATLIDEIQSELGDDTTTYTDAIITIQLEDAFRELSDYESYVMLETFRIESRTGTADEDKSGALVDDAKTQFVSTAADVGQVIQNTTDKTWAVVTAYVDTGELTLSKDIFPDGDEAYEIFNKGCSNKYQVYIGDVTDYIGDKHGVFAVEHPIGESRNFTVAGDILTIDVSEVDDSGGTAPDVEVYVWFNKRHRVSQLADLAGTVNGTPSAGATTFVIAAVGSGTDVIAEDTLFSVAGVRGTYKMKYDLTLSSGGGTIVFWPGLESAPSSGAIVAFIGSTLNRTHERLVVELTAARCALSRHANEIPKGGTGTYGRYETKLAIVLDKLEVLKRNRPPDTSRIYSRD